MGNPLHVTEPTINKALREGPAEYREVARRFRRAVARASTDNDASRYCSDTQYTAQLELLSRSGTLMCEGASMRSRTTNGAHTHRAGNSRMRTRLANGLTLTGGRGAAEALPFWWRGARSACESARGGGGCTPSGRACWWLLSCQVVPWEAACPLSTRGGTRLVRLVRGRGGGGERLGQQSGRQQESCLTTRPLQNRQLPAALWRRAPREDLEHSVAQRACPRALDAARVAARVNAGTPARGG
jgi:hypothetical protein